MQIFLSVAIFVFIVSSKIYRLGRKLVGIILCILVWLLAVEAMEGNPMVNWNKTPCWDLNAKFVNNVHEPVWSCLLYSEPIHTEFHYTMRGRNSALWKWRPEFRRMFYKPRTDFDNYRRVNKFALLWGEAQLCLPYVCLYKKIADSYPKVTYSYPRVHKSPHKFMLTSYMKYFAKFLALLLAILLHI